MLGGRLCAHEPWAPMPLARAECGVAAAVVQPLAPAASRTRSLAADDDAADVAELHPHLLELTVVSLEQRL